MVKGQPSFLGPVFGGFHAANFNATKQAIPLDGRPLLVLYLLTAYLEANGFRV